jgi:hypothetical protein
MKGLFPFLFLVYSFHFFSGNGSCGEPGKGTRIFHDYPISFIREEVLSLAITNIRPAGLVKPRTDNNKVPGIRRIPIDGDQ